MTQIVDDDYYTLPEAAQHSRYTYYVLYNGLIRGDLSGVFFRGRWYVEKASLKKFSPNPVGRPKK